MSVPKPNKRVCRDLFGAKIHQNIRNNLEEHAKLDVKFSASLQEQGESECNVCMVNVARVRCRPCHHEDMCFTCLMRYLSVEGDPVKGLVRQQPACPTCRQTVQAFDYNTMHNPAVTSAVGKEYAIAQWYTWTTSGLSVGQVLPDPHT